ncbi:MAG: S8 family serine peptidase, partial [Ignavibacterium sp.]|nr:S8 family serine peptidase [Ignavibacterium sp.]MDW8375939.1 S8 family serine peptidase [Ignavibacteriales bacterium]
MIKKLNLSQGVLILIFLTVIAITNIYPFERVLEKNGVKYLSNTLIIKLKNQPIIQSDKSVVLPQNVIQFFKDYSIKSVRALYSNEIFEKSSTLGRIIELKYESDVDPFFISSKLSKVDLFEWIEPRFVYELSFIPNDPSYSQQYALSRINAAQAWDISQGDTSVFIGIVDTGVDWDHPDLEANIWINWNEIPNNGIDDDNNGFIDDIRGWDFGGLNGTPDNNPMEDQPDHGTHVAGIASAVTNNGIGVASIGFKCKIMAIKTTRNDMRGANGPYIIFGYEGIVYAANNGAKVINCSWGGGAYSIYGQEIINFAISRGALVVCAAGNSNSIEPFYPAAYNGAFSVASTTNT